MSDETVSILQTVGPSCKLDRMSVKRADKIWLQEERERGESRYLLLVDLKPVVQSLDNGGAVAIRWFLPGDVAAFDLSKEGAFFLGQDEMSRSYFALELDLDKVAHIPDPEGILQLSADIRTLSLNYDIGASELALVGEAYAMAAWHRSQQCCGRCGAHAIMRDGGWRRQCRSCGQDYFPRSDPAVIMAVSDGKRLLLAHESHFPDKLYSVLAGFIEPGESIEEAVRREVYEEAGIGVSNVSYVASQPWPFPHSLMIGCKAEALTMGLQIDRTEIADARWFEKDEVLEMLGGTHEDGLFLPPPLSIANQLIRGFAGV